MHLHTDNLGLLQHNDLSLHGMTCVLLNRMTVKRPRHKICVALRRKIRKFTENHTTCHFVEMQWRKNLGSSVFF